MRLARFRNLAAAALGLAALFAVTGARADDPCNQVPERFRARCEEGLRVRAACVGLQGDARRACQERHINYAAAREDCSKLAGEAKIACQQHNRSMALASPCRTKTGPDLEACLKAQATMRGPGAR